MSTADKMTATLPDVERALELLLTVRGVEERCLALIKAGEADGIVMHSSLGAEGPAVALGLLRTAADVAFSSHRGMGHCAAWGVDLVPLVAESIGRTAGFARGLAGHMHIIDPQSGMLGTNGVVGAGLPQAVGAGLGLRHQRSEGVAVGFFGDGALNTGAASEALNLAAAWGARTLFVCEDNGLAEMTYSAPLTAGGAAERLRSFGMPFEDVDGNDLFALHAAAERLLTHVREADGPAVLLCRTYRVGGHYIGDGEHYRDPAERERRPRDVVEDFVARAGIDADHLAAVSADVARRLDAVIDTVRSSPRPTEADLRALEAYL